MRLVLILLIFFPIHLFSQFGNTEKAGIQLRHYLENSGANVMVPLLLKANADIFSSVEMADGKIRMQVENYYSVEIPAKNVLSFLENEKIVQVDFSLASGKMLNDSMRVNNNIDSLQYFSKKYPSTHTGKGVIVGIIDSGIDFHHADFKDSLGNTRVLNIWDQTVPTMPSRVPQPYNYGVEWDSSDINAGICTHVDPANNFGHGTMVAGAAAGNALASGSYKGAAPSSDIIVVATDFNRINWLQSLAEAVDYIFKKAEQLQRPCVINISAGTYAGSHDGKDIAAQIIDQLIKSKEGRAVVAAAGNAGQIKFHLGYQVTADTNFTWFEHESALFSNGGIFFELYADTADFKQVQFGFGADILQPNYNLRGHTTFRSIHSTINQLVEDTLWSYQGHRLAIIKSYAEETDGVYSLEIAIFPDSLNYNYRFSTTGNGKFDVWSSFDLMASSDIISSNLPSVSAYPSMAYYKEADTLQSMVSSFTCLASVVTVANYINRSSYPSISGITQMGLVAGEISPNSSLGPTRTGLQKPDIAAPGDIMISASKLDLIQQLIQTEPSKVSADSLHMRNGGTSMAAPGVAGILALYLEKCPKADYLEMKNALINNARKDNYTTLAFSNKWGHGKADAYQSLMDSNFPLSIFSSNLIYCQGDTAAIYSNGTHFSYSWSNGDSSSTALIDSSGSYFLIAGNQSACRSISDTLTFQFFNTPMAPILSLQNDTIYSSYTGFHKWYFNGSIIAGENSDRLKWSNYGQYYAEAVDTNNSCSSFSDTLSIHLTSIVESNGNPFYLYPNPAHCDKIWIAGKEGNYELNVFSVDGRKVLQRNFELSLQPTQLNLCPMNSGIYFLHIKGHGISSSQKLLIQ